MPQVTDPLLLQSLQQQEAARPPQQVTDPNTIATLAPSFGARLSGEQPGPLIPSPTQDQGRLLPLRDDPTGGITFDPYAGVLGSLLRGITAPGDVASGRVPIMGPGGGYNPDMVRRGIDTASIIGPVNPAVRAGTGPIPGETLTGLRMPNVTPPSATTLNQAADLGFTDVRLRGPDVLSSTIGDTARQTRQTMLPRFAEASAPQTYSALESMTNPVRSWTSMTDVLARRDALRDIAAKGGPDGQAAREAMGAIDNMISSRLDPTNTRSQYSGAPRAPMAPGEVAPALETARGNWGAAARSNELSGELDRATTGMVERAEGRAASTYSGGNLDNNIRASARSMLEQNKKIGGYSPEEISALEDIRDGNLTRNAARFLGNTFGGQGGIARLVSGATGGAAATALGLPPYVGALGLPAAGSMARAAANAGARGSVAAADALLRSRSPLYEEMLANARPVAPIGREEAIGRAVLPGLLAPRREPLVPRPPPGFI